MIDQLVGQKIKMQKKNTRPGVGTPDWCFFGLSLTGQAHIIAHLQFNIAQKLTIQVYVAHSRSA